MIPLLYDKTGKMELGELNNCIECLVEEERNGLFEVSLIYPINDAIHSKIVEENIIVCDANDVLKAQQFRIYMTRKMMNNKIQVFARHISFDLAYDFIESINIERQPCEYALNEIFRKSNFSKDYTGHSDIVAVQDYNIEKANCIEAIAGKKGSIIDTYGTGAEILRDNKNIHILNKRGHDNDVSVEYAKNLTGFELEEDYSELVTVINAYAKYTDNSSGESKEVIVEANNIQSPLVSNYSHPYIIYKDYSDKFQNGEQPTKEKLIQLAEDDFKNNKIDKPKQNYKIEFIPLSKCVGYNDLEDKISLCDIVTIVDTRYNVNTKAKVIRTVFNVLKDRYESMELGEPRTTLGDIIGDGTGESVQQGPPGPQGPPGADGSVGDFPDSIPATPVLKSKVYGFSQIELSWTYEDKVYYQYELYASKIMDFIPNTFDLIHKGQSSSFLFQGKPDETWYFKVCGINSHGRRSEFSNQEEVTTVKIDDLSNYVDNASIGDALIGELNLGRGWFGQLKGNYIDAKLLTVTDGNMKRRLHIDDFGNMYLNPTQLIIDSNTDTNIATKDDIDSIVEEANQYTDARIEVVSSSISQKVSKSEYDQNNQAISQQVSEIKQTAEGIKQEVSNKIGANEVKSIIQQSPSDIKIGFNKINNNIQFSESEMQINTGNGKSLTLKNGRLNTYDYSNGKVLGYIGQTYTSAEGTNYPGNVFGNAYNSYYTVFGLDGNYSNDSQQTGNGFDSFMTIVYYAHNNLTRGVYFNKPLHFNDNSPINAGEINLAKNIVPKYSNTSYCGTLANPWRGVYSNIIKSGTFNLTLATANSGSRYGEILISDDGYIYPSWGNGKFDLGTESARFGKLRCVSPVDVSSDRNLKENIKPIQFNHARTLDYGSITYDDMYNFVRDDLNLNTYNYKDVKEKNSEIGFIAQDIIDTKIGKEIINIDETLSYSQGSYINVLAGALKQAIQKIDILENKLNSL